MFSSVGWRERSIIIWETTASNAVQFTKRVSWNNVCCTIVVANITINLCTIPLPWKNGHQMERKKTVYKHNWKLQKTHRNAFLFDSLGNNKCIVSKLSFQSWFEKNKETIIRSLSDIYNKQVRIVTVKLSRASLKWKPSTDRISQILRHFAEYLLQLQRTPDV